MPISLKSSILSGNVAQRREHLPTMRKNVDLTPHTVVREQEESWSLFLMEVPTVFVWPDGASANYTKGRRVRPS